MSLICSEMLHSLLILLRNVPYVVDVIWNILNAIDKLRYVSFVSDMLQLLYAPSVRNQICMIKKDNYDSAPNDIMYTKSYILLCFETASLWKLYYFDMDMLVTC